MTSDKDASRFEFLLQETLRHLPAKAEPFVKGLAIVIEDRPADGPPRLVDWTQHARTAMQYSEGWSASGNPKIDEPQGRITLYRDAILEAGGDLSEVLRGAILRAIEGNLGVDAGALEREVGGKQDDSDEPEELVGDPAAPDPSDGIVEIAESEVELMSLAERAWFDDVEIAAVDHPEADGDPGRLADFPVADDDPKALVLYTANILRLPDSPVESIRGLLKEAIRRAGVV